jgi:large-conductance mechanosensitive channel
MGLRAFWNEFKAFAFKGNMIDLAVAVVIGAAFSGVITSLVSDIIMPGLIYVTTTAAEAKDKATALVTAPTTAPATTQASPEDQAKAAALLVTAEKNLGASETPQVKAYENIQALQGIKGLPSDVQDQVDKASGRLQTIQQATGTAAPAPAPTPPAPAQPKVVTFDWKLGPLNIGNFIGALINFVLIALAVFVTIVKLLGSVMKKFGPKEDAPVEPVTKECPFCLSVIPIKAIKCSHCTADLPAIA